MDQDRTAFLVGMVAGEATFFVSPNNGGQSWVCGFALKLRDDDCALLTGLRDFVGCGVLHRVPARRTSRPQLGWHIHSKRECLRLIEKLGTVPMPGKKSGDLRIWSDAVRIWSARDADTWERLRVKAAELVEHRRYGSPSAQRVDITTRLLDPFLAGFATAEGHLGVTPDGHPRFVIKLRADDSNLLRLFRDRYEIGTVSVRSRADGGHPTVSWVVSRRGDVQRLVEVFDRCSLRGRKAAEYVAWRELVRARSTRPAGRRRTSEEKAHEVELASYVRRLREYRAPLELPPRRSLREERRERCVAVLRKWAAASPGVRLSATQYVKYRKSQPEDLPTRNTVARLFGSWRSAMIAADLPTDATRDATTTDRIARRNRERRPARMKANRKVISKAIRRCANDLGAEPTATHFFRWRLANAPETPSHMTLYRCFQDGFDEALAFALADSADADAA